MPSEPPIACSLSATELPTRLAQIVQLGRDSLLDARIHGTRARLRFAPGARVRERVAAIVAAESACCAFLTMQVSEARDEVVLTIEAPADAELVLAELANAFRGDPQTAS
ncbi:MAG: hypothetical protein QOK21_1793 [Solirubrobacteraceae bacterium]|nr:hypothetical protein [Solirubrobacteraceae bacterium]